MPRKFINSTRKQQKLIYSFIKQYANYLQSRSEYALISEYWLYEAKKQLKLKYVKATKELRSKEPLEAFKSNIKETLSNVIARELKKETKIEIIIDDIEANLKEFIEDLAIKLGSTETFSLALNLTSKEKATKFIQYLIDYFLDNEISIGKELHDLIVESEHDKFIYACLKNKKCAICGRLGVDFEHYIPVARLGGYKNDYGQGLYWSLCREHHTEKHEKTEAEFFNKYKKRGIELSEEQVKVIGKLYKNHLNGRKK